jgi:hypothetical protein
MNVNVDPRDIAWTGTGGISDTQSYAWIILNAVFDRLSTSSLFENFTVRRITRALPIEAGYQIPSLGVYLGPEIGDPDGDVNAADIRFMHTVPIGVQIVIKNNDPVAMQATLDQAKWFVLNQLFRDDSFTNRLKTSMPDNVTFEGIPKLRIPSPEWGTTGAKNETPVGIQLVEFHIRLRTMWYPTEFDELKEIVITTGFPGPNATQEERDEIQQVKVVHYFNPDYVPLPYPGPLALPDGVAGKGEVGILTTQVT